MFYVSGVEVLNSGGVLMQWFHSLCLGHGYVSSTVLFRTGQQQDTI